MSQDLVNEGRILLADDDNAYRLATCAFLRQQGFDCDAVQDAATAVERLRTQAFDLLIADINMPGNPALELVERLSELAQGLPVILLTGYPTLQSAARSVRLQVVAYLVKPCDPDEFLEVARQAITHYRAYRAINTSRGRVETWSRDLVQIEETLRRLPGGSRHAATDRYLDLTLQNLLGVLVDLRQFAEALGTGDEQRQAAQQVALYRALQDTVQVLEKTRQSFKSKELGDLRRRLETLLHSPPTPPGVSGPESLAAG